MSLRVGLCGYGLAGEAFHSPVLSAVDGLELAGVVTRDPGRRAKVAERWPRALVVDEVAPLLGGEHRVDLLVVATANAAHVPLARAALEAGVPVVVDKPVAATAAEARELAALADARSVALIPFHNRRWDGDFLTARALLDEGRLGELRRLESRFERWRPEPKGGWRELGDPAEGGGLLLDLGPHLVDQALLLGGPGVAVYAELVARRPGAAVDDDTFVALEHASGVRSHLWMSAVAAQPGVRLVLQGSRAAYRKDGLDPQEEALRGGGAPGDAGFGEELEADWGTIGTGIEDRARVPTRAGDYAAFYRGVLAHLTEGAPPPVAAADAVAGLEVLDAARTSSAERRVVEL